MEVCNGWPERRSGIRARTERSHPGRRRVGQKKDFQNTSLRRERSELFSGFHLHGVSLEMLVFRDFVKRGLPPFRRLRPFPRSQPDRGEEDVLNSEWKRLR